MKKSIIPILALVTLLIVTGCPNHLPGHDPFKYPTGHFPSQPVNFVAVNSQWDDYNSALPETHIGYNLIFSSNRNSQGDNFDIVGKDMHITWYMEDGRLLIEDNYEWWTEQDFVTPLLNRINTTGNEFGPVYLGYYREQGANTVATRINMITYSTNDSSDHYRLRMVYNAYINDGEATNDYGPFDLKIINNNMNPQYLTFFGEEMDVNSVGAFNENEISHLYFQAENDGQADIYMADVPVSDNLISNLTADTTYQVYKVAALSSASDDKCPFINGKTLVFTSNRPGGFGGYDLYYSHWENGQWSEPVNFGDQINSEYDEFRPVTLFANGFDNDLLIFSSNRPGGQGGFDLYYAGLPFKVFDWKWETD